MRILGVELRERTLGLAIIESKFRMIKSIKSLVLNLPGKKEENDLFIIDTLKNMKMDYTVDRVVFGLPLNLFSYSLIEMPVMSRKDLRNAFSFELEKHLPLPVDEYVFDFIPISSAKSSSQSLVLSIKKEIILGIINYVKESGLDLYAVRCSPIAVLHELITAADGKGFNGLIINISDESFEIACINNARPVRLKTCKKDTNLTAEIEGLASLYPGSIVFNGTPDSAISEKFNGRKLHLSAAAALSASAATKTPLDFNFLPQEYVREGRDYYPYILGGLAAASVILFLLSGTVSYYREWSALRSVNAQVSALKNRASGIIETQKKTVSLNQDKQVLFDFRGRSNTVIKAMSDLSRIIPVDAWIINLAIDDKGKIEIEGFAKKTALLVIALEKSGRFRNIAFTSPIIAKDSEERFAIRMDLEGF